MRRLLQVTLFNQITGEGGWGQYQFLGKIARGQHQLLGKIATHLHSFHLLTPPP